MTTAYEKLTTLIDATLEEQNIPDDINDILMEHPPLWAAMIDGEPVDEDDLEAAAEAAYEQVAELSAARYTTSQAAEIVGVTQSRIRQIAIEHNIGRMFGRDRMFTTGDLYRLRMERRPVGRPPQTSIQ